MNNPREKISVSLLSHCCDIRVQNRRKSAVMVTHSAQSPAPVYRNKNATFHNVLNRSTSFSFHVIRIITLEESNAGPYYKKKPLLLIMRFSYLEAPHYRDHVPAKTWMNKKRDREQWVVACWSLFGRDRGTLQRW